MLEDPIVEEIRRVRAERSAALGNDLVAIYRALKVDEQKSGRKFVRFPARRLRPPAKAKRKTEGI